MDQPTTIQAVVLATLPDGVPTENDFRVTALPRAEMAQGQARVKVLDLSLDPYIRSTLGGTHMGDSRVNPGDLIPGRAIAQVIESTVDTLRVGDLVLAETGWVAEAVVDADSAQPVSVPDGVPVSAALGILGMPGLTAYAAVTRHIRPRPGETVVVTSATGGVGALAGQLVTAAGARAVAVVGSDIKARFAVEELGYAVAVDRTSATFADDLREACPDRINGYLHMGDQAVLDTVVKQLAIGARVSLIGVPDQTNGAAPTQLRVGAVMAARAEVHGMVVYDHADLMAEQMTEVGSALTAGSVRMWEDRVIGLDNAGAAFVRLMHGANHGKVVVEVTPA